MADDSGSDRYRRASLRRGFIFGAPGFVTVGVVIVLMAVGVWPFSPLTFVGWVAVGALSSPLATACAAWSLNPPGTLPGATVYWPIVWAVGVMLLALLVGLTVGLSGWGVAVGAIATLPQAFLLVATHLTHR